MKTIVVHDEGGNILSFLIPVEESANEIEVQAAPGEQVVCVDSADFGIDRDTFNERPRSSRPPVLPRIIEEFRIVDGKVTRRPKPAAPDRS